MQNIIDKTAEHVKNLFEGEGTGHDWWHIYRVWQNAKHIAQTEDADMFVVELGALLHDIADHKFHDGNLEIGPQKAEEWLRSLNVADETVLKVKDIVTHVSFKGAGVASKMESLEGKIVQDADRLDAIGAIGIARTFAFGGSKSREMYNPNIPPVHHDTFDSYHKNTAPTINHFYEKLLLLKDLMHTTSAKKIAQERHAYMESFLNQFYAEWEGER